MMNVAFAMRVLCFSKRQREGDLVTEKEHRKRRKEGERVELKKEFNLE
jgi:hypothetical protein